MVSIRFPWLFIKSIVIKRNTRRREALQPCFDYIRHQLHIYQLLAVLINFHVASSKSDSSMMNTAKYRNSGPDLIQHISKKSLLHRGNRKTARKRKKENKKE